MSKSSFSEVIKQSTPTLVDFFATWCGPCQTLAPILESAKSQLGEDVSIIKIDIDRNPKVASAFQIQSVPTMMLFKDGKVLWRHSGLWTQKQIVEAIMPHLASAE